jgi:hypothetical protein
VLLAVESTAQRCCDIFKQQQVGDQNFPLVKLDLPLPKDPGELLKACTALIPAEALSYSLQRNLDNYVCGAGVNPVIFKWLLKNTQALNTFADQSEQKWALLSIIEPSSLTHGYPNCDFVGVVSHGKVGRTETPFHTAYRRVQEEARLLLPPEQEVDTWETPTDVSRHEEIHYRYLTGRGDKPVVVHVFCRVVPAVIQPDFVAQESSHSVGAIRLTRSTEMEQVVAGMAELMKDVKSADK